jgi:ribose 5-phosphate isomerase A
MFLFDVIFGGDFREGIDLMMDEPKWRAAERAIEFVKDGQVVGLGTGSTTRFAIRGLSCRVAGGLKITGVPTSLETERMATELGIPIIQLNEVEAIDITIDGADSVDPSFNMIKGGGGALTREKLVALASKKRVIIIDDSKLVDRLGVTWAVPVEVLPFAWRPTQQRLSKLGCEARVRQKDGRPFETDNGNYILDCKFEEIADPESLERSIKLVPGVVENGLFVGIADVLVIGFQDHVELREREKAQGE